MVGHATPTRVPSFPVRRTAALPLNGVGGREEYHMRKKTAIIVAVILGVSTAGVAGAVATQHGGIADSAGMIHGCYSTHGATTGTVRVIGSNGDCRSTEQPIQWNEKGQDGSNGARGLAGATGAKGAKGAKGATGVTGPVGPQGATGAVGPKGASGDNGSQGSTGATGAAGPAGNTVIKTWSATASIGQTVTLMTAGPFTYTGVCTAGPHAQTYVATSQANSSADSYSATSGYASGQKSPFGPGDGTLSIGYPSDNHITDGSPQWTGPYDGSDTQISGDGLTYINAFASVGTDQPTFSGACAFRGYATVVSS